MELEKFDLSKYAENSLNYLTKLTDEKMGYLPYWLVKMVDDPAHAKHCRVDDAELAPSWSKALTLIRKVLDTPEGKEQEAAFRKLMMENFREDGLSYSHSFPWEEIIYSNMHEACWVMDAMVYYYMDTRDDAVKEQIIKMIDALDKIAVHKTGRFFWHGYYDQPYKSAYFPFENHFEGKGLDGSIWTGRSEEVTRNGGIVMALTEFWEMTGHDKAIELAEALVNHIAFDSRKFGAEGHYVGHVHAAMWTVSGVLKFGLATKRDDIVSWARDVYEYTKKFSTSFGWVPEYVNRKDDSLELCETCCIADMIRCALLFAENGMEEYWEDVDRFTRNHLVNSQISSPPEMKVDSSLEDTDTTTWKDLDQRVVGAFSAGTAVNFFPYDRTRVAGGCCGATGAGTIFYVWNDIVWKKDNVVSVNLMMDRETDYALIESELPREGKVTVALKEDAALKVRIPVTADRQVAVQVDDEDVAVIWDGTYILLRAVNAGQKVVVKFNDPIRKTVERQAYTDYQVKWKGNTVLYIRPDNLYPGCRMNKPMYSLAPPVDYEPSRF